MAEPRRFFGRIDRALYLGSVAGFSDLEPDQLALTAAAARERFFPAGTMVARQGRALQAVWVVVEGQLRADGEGLHDIRVGPRQGVGLLSHLARSPRGFDIVAEEDTWALEFDGEAIHDAFEDDFTLFVHWMRRVAAQTLEIRQRIRPGTYLAPRPEATQCPDRGLDLVERMMLLGSRTFGRRSLDAMADLASEMEEVRFSPGQLIWRPGDPSGFMLLLLAGSVRCSFSADDAPVTPFVTGSAEWVAAGFARAPSLSPPSSPAAPVQGWFRCGTGYPVGNLESLCGRPRWFEAVAETPVLALRGETEGFLDILEDHFEMAMDFLDSMALNLLGLLESEQNPVRAR